MRATRSTSSGCAGKPLRLAGIGWLLSLALAYGVGGVLAAAGIVLSFLFTGSALATTAIGTLIPVLRDAGDLRTRFGTYLLAAGAAGEFGPILLVTIILSGQNPVHEALILLAFVAMAVVLAVVSVRSAWRGGRCWSARSSRAASSRCGSPWCSCSGWSRLPAASASTCCSAGSWPGSSRGSRSRAAR